MILNELRNLRVIQFGVGGGSWLATYISKFLGNITSRFDPGDLHVQYDIVDPDIVEDRNVRRQNFNEVDIGRSKAAITKIKNMQNFSEINPVTKTIRTRKEMKNFGIADGNLETIPNWRRNLTIVFGCVDDVTFRRNMFSYGKQDAKTKMIYIDVGNDLFHGQVITTIFNIDETPPTFNNVRHFKNPNMHKIFKKEDANTEATETCAFFGDQTQSVNLMGAILQFVALQQILVNDTLPPNYYTYNSSGYSVFEI